jgi:hypothetical protein
MGLFRWAHGILAVSMLSATAIVSNYLTRASRAGGLFVIFLAAAIASIE